MENMKKDIKIFVSHRIDLDSEIIDNPLFIPVRCGAVYDKRENITMLGDNTGDNISEKRNSFCELTVQYWAWKNIKADYYGLCHYRRYFSFADERFGVNESGGNTANCVIYPFIDDTAVAKFKMVEAVMRESIEANDIITVEPIDIQSFTGLNNNIDCVKKDIIWHEYKDFEITREVIKEFTPDFLKYYDKYMNGKKSYLYDCFIMKKEYFFLYSEWVFKILFEVEKRINTKYYNVQKNRTIGTISERLLGVFILYLKEKFNIRITEKQLVFFENTSKRSELYPAFSKNNVPIILLSSDYYVPYCGVCIQSILNNISKDYNYDFIILEKNITEENKTLLKTLIKNYKNVSLRFYNAYREIYDYNFNVQYCYSVEAYYRILAPYILKKYDKAICLDSDLIIKTDIANLFNIDLKDKSLGAVKDTIFYGFINGFSDEFMEYCEKEFKMKNHYNYVNTGVMLLNLEKIRNSYTKNEIVEFMSKNNFKIQEQDGLNLLFENDVYFLNNEWNTYSYCGGTYILAAQLAPATEYEKYILARKKPKIIHYAGRIKPWDKFDDDFAHEFWKVARETVFYETIIFRKIVQVESLNFINKSKLIEKTKKMVKKFCPIGSKRYKYARNIYLKLFK